MMMLSKSRTTGIAVLRRSNSTTISTATAIVSRSSARGKNAAIRLRQHGQKQKEFPNKLQRRNMGSDLTPVPQSQTALLWSGHTVKHEGWEESIYFYYAAGLILQMAVVFGAPETSIESWAREEAKARLFLASKQQEAAAKEGGEGEHIEFVFGRHYQELINKEQYDVWSKFSDKAINPGDDDDDDDDDDDAATTTTPMKKMMMMTTTTTTKTTTRKTAK